jgi:hypothetical protein
MNKYYKDCNPKTRAKSSFIFILQRLKPARIFIGSKARIYVYHRIKKISKSTTGK